jgi:hypothetical protein
MFRSPKGFFTILFESSIVGILLTIIIILLNDYVLKDYKNTNLIFFISGFIFHFIFEYLSINKIYCIEYNKLL